MMKLSAKAKASLERVIAKFKRGDLSAINQVARLQLSAEAPASRWSFSNRVIAFLQTSDLDCRTFRQWQQVDRCVKKGSKAAYILRPHLVKTSEEEAEEPKEQYRCIGFSPVPVFAISDTEGETSLPGYSPVALPPLTDVARRLGIRVSYQPLTPDRYGDCDTAGSRIRLGTQDSAVFFHELAHAVHARLAGNLRGGQQADQEIVAEFTAAVLMELYGVRDHSGNAWRYIEQYASDPLQAITRALGTVENVLAVLTTDVIEAKPEGM